MTAAVAAVGKRYLPRGWSHFGLQLAIWFGFLGVYQIARGMAGHDDARAIANGLRVIGWERTHAHHLFELTFQNLAASSRALELAVSWTYWNSEFTVIGLALLWVYLRRHEAFAQFRNTILLANVIGLVGYVLMPTAPPRMFPTFGFADTLGDIGGLNHGSGLIELASNPYAAMPSLHAADALIVGDHALGRLPQQVRQDRLGDLAGLGLVQRHGDGESLLARRRRRRRRRARRAGGRPPQVARARAASRLVPQ